jgi:hypothetical protein
LKANISGDRKGRDPSGAFRFKREEVFLTRRVSVDSEVPSISAENKIQNKIVSKGRRKTGREIFLKSLNIMNKW